MSTTFPAKKVYTHGRVKREAPPLVPSPLRPHNYRKCLPELKRDFQCRCAYCMKSLSKASDREMQIDHFDPREKKSKVQRYSNLFLADAHCNGTKSDSWPNKEQQAQGMRFLNCCDEQDYGCCIFENSQTHELVGTTPAAIYHIEIIDLNAPHLVKSRRDRAEVRALLTKKGYLDIKNGPKVCEYSKALEKIAEEDLIPPIPPPPNVPD